MMGESGPFGEGSGELTPVAVENFQMLKQRQTADDLSGDDASGRDRTRGRVNLLNWDGKGSPRGLFPKKPPKDRQ
jgi:nitrate reductase beta subunit